MATPIAAAKTRRILYLLASAYTALVGVSLVLVLTDVAKRYPELARSVARTHFEAAVTMRAWNVVHGGVYLQVSDQLQPNPYLDDPLRDVVTTDGTRLTKVNPAYMTRMVAELGGPRTGVRVHITSNKPLRPANRADPWEATALTESERTGAPAWGTGRDEGTEVFRYLDLLRVEKPCLRCHEQQGYRVGDVRGGISVTFSAAPFRAAAHRDRLRILGAHGLFLGLGLGLLWALGGRMIRTVTALQDSLARVRTLEGFLPICCHCKKIRREGGDPGNQSDWEQMESYVSDRTEAQFSHSLCPECLVKYYPDDAPTTGPGG